MNQQTDPIGYAVEKCLAYAVRFESPATAAVDFIHLLKTNNTLSDNEIAEVGRRVNAKLGERVSQVVFPPDGS